MKPHFVYQSLGILFFLGWLLAGCGAGHATNPPESSATAEPSKPATSTIPATTAQKTKTPLPIYPTLTNEPVMDIDGNITWHPEEVLISWSTYGNDGNDYHAENFTLFWDGELFLPGNVDDNHVPYALQLSPTEVCKILNTVNESGFFEESDDYRFRFGGLGGDAIAVNAWKTRQSSVETLSLAVSGLPYYANLYCRDCPVPSEGTIIRPGVANLYYFLETYRPENLPKIPVKEILVKINETQREGNSKWGLKSISFEQFMQLMTDCNDNQYCGYYDGKVFSGDIAREIMTGIGNAAVFEDTFSNYGYFAISYQPQSPAVPPNTTLTCNTKSGHYPVLPLNKENKFWYYAPEGQWGAERVEGQNKMRVVNTLGYEKFYGYDPAFFGQPSIQVYPRYWTNDNQFFYVNILPGAYTPNVSFDNSIGLQQIDVKNEKIKYLFLGSEGQKFSYELSNQGKKAAYIRQGDNPLKLVVVDTYSGEEHAVSLTMPNGSPYTSAGALIWSPDEDKIFIAAIYEENQQQKTHILVTHTNNLADLRIIYQADKPLKLRWGYGDVRICDLQTDGEGYCPIHLDIDTDRVQE